MSSTTLFRLASRHSPSCLLRPSQPAARRVSFLRAPVVTAPSGTCLKQFSTTRRQADAHGEESFEEFSARYEKEFDAVQDVFELQRNLNNAFAYDLVPSPSVITAALRAARRVNDYPTAVRIFEGIKVKVENRGQYHEYLRDLETLRQELGVDLEEDLYPKET